MSYYYMKLPDSQYGTIKVAYDYIKTEFPHLTEGFNMEQYLIDDFRTYSESVFHWSSKSNCLGWGSSYGGTYKIPFPDTDNILLGEII